MINKNKSESLSSRINPNRNTPSVSSKEKGKKSQERNGGKPVIDLQIAKGLDTLDRQEIKNLKKSLKASKQWNQFQKRQQNEQNYVEEQIVGQDNFEQNQVNKKKLKNTMLVDEIKQQIIQYNDEQSPNKYKPKPQNEEKKVVYEQGKTKTYIKPRPISAVQKQEPIQSRNSQIIKNSFDNNSLSFREQKNPFKKQQTPISSTKKQDSSKLTNLLKRIKHFDNNQIEQLEMIMEKIEKGEIESVEGSNDIIKMNHSNSFHRTEQQVEIQDNVKPVNEQQKIKNPFEPRSSIPTIVTLQNQSRLKEMDQTQSKIIEHPKKSVISNNLVIQKSSDSRSGKQNKSEIKSSKDSLVLLSSSFKQSINKEVKIPTRKNNVLAIKIISNWGHPKTIGLTKLELFSKSGERIQIHENQIKGCNKRMLKIFSNNTPFTINENQMWISPSPQPPSVIVIEIAPAVPVGALRIWNYNKSLIENSKGVKDVKIISNDQKWNGEIKKGCGNEHQDYSTVIKFTMNPNTTIQSIELPTVQKPLQSMSIPLVSKSSNNKWLQQTLMRNQLLQLTGDKDKQKQAQKKQDKQKSKINQNKIQRSGSYEIRKSGVKTSVSNRVEAKQQRSQLNISQATQPKKYLEQQAESVKKDVEESLKKLRMNLLFGEDIITKDIQNQKHAKTQNRKSKKELLPIAQVQEQMLLEQRQSSSYLKKNKRSKIVQFPQALKSNYESNVPSRHQKIQKSHKPSPLIIKKQQEQQVYNVNNYLSSSKHFPVQEDEPTSGNKLEIKDDRIKIVKPALIKNVSSILNQNEGDELGELMKQLNDILPSHAPIKIQELPKGTKLSFILMTNYGDPYYVGLSKIQIFDKYGNLLDIGFGQISGKCEQYPISNLINQNIKVYDKNSLWLTQLRKSNKITIDLQVPTSISLIRIWNYNESRIHNSRGVKMVSIELDNFKIFEGQISKFNGQYNYEDCEYLVFTEDKSIINKIIENDWVGKIKDHFSDNQLKDTITNFERPTTAQHQDIKLKEIRNFSAPSNSRKYKNTYQTPVFPKGKCLEIVILSTWGDRHYVGLNKIQVFNSSKVNILAKPSNYKISAMPSSVSSLPGMSRDQRTVDKLASGEAPRMWLSPMNSDLDRLDNNINSVTIKFSSNQTIGMINIWNYSKSPARGVREVMVILDDVIIYQGYISNSQQKSYTSIGFTKDGSYLEELMYQGYNQDTIGQMVGLINERNQVKSTPVQSYNEMERPFTSVLGK